MISTIQISIDGKWIIAGTFEPVEKDIAKGIAGGGLFEYMLSPLYDFTPMFLDPVGIPRSSR